MNRVQSLGPYEAQFNEILSKALDKSVFATLTTHAVADTEFSVEHGLGFAPRGYIVIKADKAADVYDGTTANTDALLYLRCNVASAAIRLMVF